MLAVSAVTLVAFQGIECLSALLDRLYEIAKKVIRYILTRSFYAGYKELTPKLVQERTDSIIATYNARRFPCGKIDALYVPAPPGRRTGNLIVICLNTIYQDHHPRHWKPYLENGADVFLWNPTKKNPISYSDDLASLLQSLRSERPEQVIAVQSYCAGTDPAIRSVDLQSDPNIHLIVDRGHGDITKLCRSVTFLARLGIVKTVLREDFDCGGIKQIGQIRGKSLFLSPTYSDQVMDCKSRNLTRELYYKTQGQTLIGLKNHDHWSRWDHATYDKVLKFLAGVGIVQPELIPTSPESFPPTGRKSCFAKRCVPILIKPC